MKRIAQLLPAVFLYVLSACGGAGSDAPAAAAVVDKYLGSWSRCEEGNPRHTPYPKSRRFSMNFTKVSDAVAQVTITVQTYPIYDCTGVFNTDPTLIGTAAIDGTKNIGHEIVDKVDFKVGQEATKNIFIIRSDGKLYTGIGIDKPGASFDAQGYPDKIDPDSALIRQ